MTHALFASLSAAWRHQQSHMICWPLARWMGFTIFIASFVGATASKAVSSDILQAVFALLAFVSGVLMVLPQKEFTSARSDASFSRPLAVGIAVTIGALGGLVGQEGSFLLIPSIASLLQIPLPIAVGTNLPIVALASLSGFLGKLMTHQIPVEIGLACLRCSPWCPDWVGLEPTSTDAFPSRAPCDHRHSRARTRAVESVRLTDPCRPVGFFHE